MNIKKAGCILINPESNKIGLVYRKKLNDFTFPKGHLEKDETFEECAIRETEEETGRICSIIKNKNLPVLYYSDFDGNPIESHYFIAYDKDKSDKVFKPEDVEELIWTSMEDVEITLTYDDLKEYWNNIKPILESCLIANKN